MSHPLALSNLLAYAIQVAILAATAALLPRLLRIRLPAFLLAYWQLVLLACLALPLMQTWQQPTAPDSSAQSAIGSGTVLPLSPIEDLALFQKADVPWQGWVVAALLLGVGLRLLWLLLGLARLRQLRVGSQRLGAIPKVAELYCRQFGLQPEIYLSSHIDSPASFGLLRPQIILPRTFADLEESQQRGIVCHELLHLKRRDWLFVLAEEGIKALLWFHPAIWWLTSRIRLAREQSVDREVVRRTGQRKAYLDLLLQTAEARLLGRAALAPSFFRPGHLSQRVASLVEEVSMSRIRLVQSAIVMVGLLLPVGKAALWAFPLELPAEAAARKRPAAPQGEPLRVGGSVMASKLIYRVDPEFPELARRARVQGVVFIKVTVNEQGEVWRAEIVRGHPLLNQAALEAVRQWIFSPVLLKGEPIPAQSTITVQFRLSDEDGEPAPAPQRPRVRLAIDPEGNVWEGKEQLSDADLDRIGQEAEGNIFVALHPDAPRSAVERVTRQIRTAIVIGPRAQTMATLIVESSREALQLRLGERSGASVFAAYLDGRGHVEGLEYLSGPEDPALQQLALAQLEVFLNQQRSEARPRVSLESTELYVALLPMR